MIPKSTVSLNENTAETTLKLLDELENIQDVQKVHSNADFPDNILEKYLDGIRLPNPLWMPRGYVIRYICVTDTPNKSAVFSVLPIRATMSVAFILFFHFLLLQHFLMFFNFHKSPVSLVFKLAFFDIIIS